MLDPTLVNLLVSNDQRIVVTGSSGWLGLASLDCLAQAFGNRFASRVVCVGSHRRQLRLQCGVTVDQIALAELQNLPCKPTWVLHYAFLTKDRADSMSEAAYREANLQIGEAVLSSLDAIGAQGIFVASSGAAYRAEDTEASDAMRLYGALKLADEVRFTKWAQGPNRRAVIARIFNVTGPYINKHEAYALASFILDGLAGRDIEVRAPRRVVRGYVPISEILSLAISELASERQGVCRFDTGGDPLDLGEVAEIVAAHFPEVKVRRADIIEPVSDAYYGDSLTYKSLLDQHRIEAMPLHVQVGKTIDYLRLGT